MSRPKKRAIAIAWAVAWPISGLAQQHGAHEPHGDHDSRASRAAEVTPAVVDQARLARGTGAAATATATATATAGAASTVYAREREPAPVAADAASARHGHAADEAHASHAGHAARMSDATRASHAGSAGQEARAAQEARATHGAGALHEGHGQHVAHTVHARPEAKGGSDAEPDGRTAVKPAPAHDHDHDQQHHLPHGPSPAAAGVDLPADAPPIEPIPVVTAADRAAAFPPALHGHAAHGRRPVTFVQLARLEAWDADPGTGIGWELQAWHGTDEHKLWLRSEGERERGDTHGAALEVLAGRPISPWWDLLAGVRHDISGGPSQTSLALGVVGLAPYKFEVAATAYLAASGQAALRVEAEYETLLTNQLILQSSVEATAFGRDDARRGIGAGLSSVEAGFRLRYEFTRRFAPYIGLVRERAFGRTADARSHGGEATDETRVVFGLRTWF